MSQPRCSGSSTPTSNQQQHRASFSSGPSAQPNGPSSPFSIPIPGLSSFLNSNSFINTSSTLNNLMSGGRSSGPNGSASVPPTQAGSRPAPSPSVCEFCFAKFNLLRRRKNCCYCRLDYCNNCMQESGSRKCRRCGIFTSRPLDRTQIMSLKVKDLKWYLEREKISSNQCNEKVELVDLIFRSCGYDVTPGAFNPDMAQSYQNNRRTSDDPLMSRPGDHGDDAGNVLPPHPVLSTPDSSTTNTSSSDASNWVMVDEDDVEESRSQQTQTSPTEPIPPGAASASGGTSLCMDGARFSPSQYSCTTSAHRRSPAVEIDRTFNIDDVKSEDQIHDLSARQLKLILTRNFVDYKGCCERDELMDKVLRLWKEKKLMEQQDMDDIPDENVCKICMEFPIDCVLLECGHMISCVRCGKRLSECPICRQYVVRAVRIFKS